MAPDGPSQALVQALSMPAGVEIMASMPRRKGKANRRVKDWSRRFREGDASAEDAAQSETLLPPRVKLPAFRLQPGPDESDLADRARSEGMVTGLFPGGACVRIGREELLCRLAGTFRAPRNASALAVGDRVSVALTPPQHVSGEKDLDKVRADGVILSRQPRETALSRPQPTSGKRRGRHDEEVFEQVIAANMEILLVVASVRQPATRPGLIDRYCIVAERGDMRPIVAINKTDLADPDESLVAELTANGIAVFRCSALKRAGLEELLEALRGHSSVLAGASGVGKSSLINAVVPGANVPTREVRAKDQRGRHATGAARVYELPGGGLLVDTPGVRELAVEMQPTELAWYFPEMAALAQQCKFNDCTHTHEPDCAVRSAIETGQIPARRYQGYLRILEML